MNSFLPVPIAEVEQVALLARDSQFFGGQTIPQLMVKLLAGKEWGVSPVASMTDVYVVKGKPQASGTLLRAMVKKHPKYNFKIRHLDNDKAVMEWFERDDAGQWESQGFSSFSQEDAKTADYTSNRQYAKVPRNMLLARATSDGFKFYCSEITMGSIYHEGEIELASGQEPLRQVTEIPEADGHPQDVASDPGPEVIDAEIELASGQELVRVPVEDDMDDVYGGKPEVEVIDAEIVQPGTSFTSRVENSPEEAPAEPVAAIPEPDHVVVPEPVIVAPEAPEAVEPTVVFGSLSGPSMPPCPEGVEPKRWEAGLVWAMEVHESLDGPGYEGLMERLHAAKGLGGLMAAGQWARGQLA